MVVLKKILSQNGEPMLSARDAAKRLGCAQDYISKLCREGKLRGTQVNGAWFVEETSIGEFEAARVVARTTRAEALAQQRRSEAEEYRKANGLPAPKKQLPAFRVPALVGGKTLTLALGSVLLFAAVAFAGVLQEKDIAAGTSPSSLAAALAQIDSPFFGARPMEVTTNVLPQRSIASEAVSKIFSFFLDREKPRYASLDPEVERPIIPTPATSTVVYQNTYPVVERTVERVVAEFSLATVDQKIEILRNELLPLISLAMLSPRLSDGTIDRIGSGGGGGSGDGSVTSVDASGGSTGLSFSGGPVTSSGTLTLGGVLDIDNGGTGTSTAPSYGQVLLGDGSGGYNLVATSSLGITAGSAAWGAITGTLSDQTDLQTELDAKLSLSTWYATTTDGLDEGGTNLYYTDGRVNTYVSSLDKGFFFSTTSSEYWGSTKGYATFGYLFPGNATSTLLSFEGGLSTTNASTTALSAYTAAFGGTATTTIDAAGNLAVGGTLGVTGDTTLANATSTYFFATTASSTNLFSALAEFGNATTTNATSTSFAITGVTSSILKTNANGSVVAAVAGTDYLTSADVFSYPFPSNATSTTLTFSGGLLSTASTTVGGGTQTTGLTIFGGATTTGNAVVSGTGTSTFAGNLEVSGNLNLLGVYGNAWSDFCEAITGGAGLCDGADNTGGGGNGLATSTDIADTWIIFGTSAADVGAEAAFTYDDATDVLTVPYASTTAVTVSGTGYFDTASTTNLTISSLGASAGQCLTVNSSGTVSTQTCANFSYPFPSNATSTLLTFSGGLLSYASTTIGDGTAAGGLTVSGSATTTGNLIVQGNATTSALAITSLSSVLLKTDANGNVIPAIVGSDYLNAGSIFAYPFPNNATTTGLGIYASSTIGGGTQATGLTIFGGATTTGNLVVSGTGSSTFAGALTVSGTGTSTFAGGVDISDGCFAVDGACLDLGDTPAGGNNTEVQYNDNGAFGGSANFTFDSSASRLTVSYASTTALTVSGAASTTNLTVSGVASSLLSTNSSGAVQNTTVSSPLSFAAGTLSITQSGSASNGYLSSTDWNTFNNKISSTSLSSASVISYNSSTGVITTQAGTFAGNSSSVYTFPGDIIVTGNSTTTNATTTSLYISGQIAGAGLSACSDTADKLLWNASTNQFDCGTDSGASGSDINWTNFNGSGIRVTTASNQVLIGNTSTSTLSKLEVVGGATIDNATTTTLYNSGIASFNGNVGFGSTTPWQKLSVSGGNILQVASGNPTLASSTLTGGATYATYVSGNYAYVAANTGGLKILDIHNPASPVLVGTYATANTARDVVVSGKYAYIANSGTGLHIVDISNPTSPAQVGTYAVGNASYSLALSGKYVYMVDFNNAVVEIVDVSNPVSPVSAGSIAATNPVAIAVSGKYAYVADYPSINIYDISNPASASLVGSYSTNVESPIDMTVVGNLVYVADEVSGLYIIDATNPASPSLEGAYDPSGTANYYGVAVAGNYAYLAEHSTGEVVVVDVSNPSSPALVGAYDTSDALRGVTVAGKYAYVSTESTTLKIIDLNGATFPAANIGSLQTGSANITESLNVGGDIYAGGGLNVGVSGIFSRGGLSVYGTTTLQALTATKATTTAATSTNFFATTASSTNLFSALAQFGRSTTTQATTTNFAITGLTSTLLKTNSDGSVVAAVAGTDYVAGSSFFAYPFPSNATSTTLTFNNGLLSTASSTFTSAVRLSSLGAGTLNVGSGGLLYSGATTTFSGGLTYSGGNVTLDWMFPSNATSTTLSFTGGLLSTASSTFTGDFRLPSLSAGGLAVDSTGLTYTYSTSTWTFASSTLLSDNNTFSGTNAFGILSATYASTTQIGSTDSAYFATAEGSVGIGTTSPSALLTLASSTGSSVLKFEQADGAGSQIDFNQDGFFRLGAAGQFQPQLLIIGDQWSTDSSRQGEVTFRYGPDGDFQIQSTNGVDTNTTRLLIDTSGNVGIGTTSPFAKLSVAGGTTYLGTDLVATGTVQFTNLTSGALATDASGNAYTFSTSTWTFASSTLLADNNTFSGSNTFTSALTADSFIASNAAATSTFAGGLAVETSGLVYDYSTNRVGIGTSSPEYSLDVIGNQRVYVTGSPDALRFTSDQSSVGLVFDSTGNSSRIRGTTSGNSELQFITNGSERVRVDEDGNVGIGTTTPASTLSVQGNTLISGNLSTAGLTATGTVQFTGLTSGLLYADSTGTLSSVATSTWTFASSTLLADNNTFSGDNTFSSTLTFSNYTDGSLAVNSSGGLYSAATTTFSSGLTYANGNVTLDWMFPSNATSTTLSFTGGLLSTASSTFTGDFRLPSLSAGGLAVDSTGLTYTYSTSTWTFASSTLLSDNNTFSGDTTLSGTLSAQNATSTGFAITSLSSELLKVDANGNVIEAIAGTDYATPANVAAAYPFQGTGNSTSTLTQFNGGLTSYASTTIGAGTQATGLTVSGGATTTGSQYIAGNLGVGTQSSLATLQVDGSGTGSQWLGLFAENGITPENSAIISAAQNKALSVQGDGAAYFMARDITNNIEGVFGTSNAGAIFFGSMTAHDLQLRTGNTTNVTIQQSTGNVGIGVTNPASAKLTIDTASNTSGIRLLGTAETAEIADIYVGSAGQLVLSTANTTDTAAYIEANAEDDEYGFLVRDSSTGSTVYTNFYTNDAATDYLNINVGATNATPGFVLQQGGNVGLGTTSPFAKLSVAGSAYIGGNLTATGTVQFTALTSGALATDASGNAYTFSTSTWTFASSTLLADNNTFSGSNTFTSALTADSFIASNAAATSTFAGGLAVETSGLVYDYSTNNVGIGTASPSSQLHIYESVNDVVRLRAENPNSGTGAFADLQATSDTGSLTIQSFGSGYTASTGFDSSSLAGFGRIRTESGMNGLIFDAGGANPLIFGTNATERLRVTSTGNVGIGTSTPYSKLSVWASGSGTGASVFELTDSASTTLFTVNDSGTASTTNLVISGLGASAGGLAVDSTGLSYTFSTSTWTFASSTLLADNNTFSGSNTFTSALTADSFVASNAAATSTFAGGLAVETSGLVYDYSTNRVGIGTETPGGKLVVATPDVANEIALVLARGTAESGALTFRVNGGSGVGHSVGVGTTRSLWFYPTSGNFGIGDVGFGQDGANPDVFFDSSTGNFGVGTTSPYAKLSVWGNANGNAFEVVSHASTTLFTVLNNGNVGISTTTPNSWLSEELVIDAVNGSSDTLIGIANGATAYKIGVEGDTNFTITDANEDQFFSVTTDGDVGIGETSPGSKLAVSGGASIGASYDTTAAPTNGLIVEGNAGFGTSSPIAPFAIANTSGNTLWVENTGGARAAIIVNSVLGTQQSILQFSNANTAAFQIGKSSEGNFFAYDNFNGAYIFNYSTSTQGFNFSSGNVGIGTSTPGTQLSIGNTGNDTINLSPTATSTFGSGINLRTGCFSINDTCVGGGSGLTGSTGQVAYFSGTDTAVGTSSVFISPSGNVGIGTTSPAAELHVFNSTSSTAIIEGLWHANLNINKGGSSSRAEIHFQNLGVDTWVIGSPDSDDLGNGDDTFVIGTSDISPEFVIKSSGNVGIGTSTPTYQLSVEGSSSLGNQAIAGYFTATSTTATSTFAGSLAIGTTSPVHALTVANAPYFGWTGAGFYSSDITAGSYIDFHNSLGVKTGGFVFNDTNQSKGTGLFFKSYSTSNDISFGYETLDGSSYTESLRIDSSSGNVGIGTSTPYSKLSVWGGSTGNIFEAVTSASSTAFVINSSGNVGIGTTTTNNLFTIDRGGSDGFIKVVGTNGDFEYSGGSDGIFWFTNAGPVTGKTEFTYNNTRILAIANSGNVGIGTTTPWRKLSVTDAVSTAQQVIAYDNSNYASILVNATGDLVITTSGGDATFSNDNLFVCQSGSCPTTTATSSAGNLFVENAVTIGSGFSFREIDSDELGLYEPGGSLIVIFDEGI